MVTVSSEVYVVLKTRIRDGSLVPIGEDVRKLQHRTLQTKYGLEIKLPPITTWAHDFFFLNAHIF